MNTYNHAFDIAFTVISNEESGMDVTPNMIILALLRRIADLAENGEVIEAVGAPFDTYEEN